MKRTSEKHGSTWLTGISFAMLAAVLFGASTPFAKILLGKTDVSREGMPQSRPLAASAILFL